jgi:hypothetical protein
MSREWALFLLLPLSASASVWVVPGVVSQSATGSAGTSIRVLNQGGAPTNASFDLLPSGNNPAPPSVTESLLPGQTLALDDVLATLWGLTDATGALRITADQPLTITARVTRAGAAGNLGADLHAIAYNDLLTGGHTGQAIWAANSADATQGYAATAGVVLMLPQTSVDIVVYDASGKQLQLTKVTGGPGVQEMPLANLISSDLPIGTVAFVVHAGRAGGYLTLTDNISGDAMVVNAMEAVEIAPAVLASLTHMTNPDGSFSRSGLRLYNPGASTADATLSLLASTVTGLPAFQTVTLAGGQTMEIDDLLSQFNAPDPTNAAILVIADKPFSPWRAI